jgi:hypothetical protein
MTDLRSAFVLTHVAAMVGLFGTVTIEGVALRFLRRATTYEQAREWTRLWTLLPAIGAPSILLSLASGIYLATTLGMWDFRWTQIAVPTLVIVATAGGAIGPRRNRLRSAIGANTGPLPVALQDEIRDRLYSISWFVRMALLSGLVVDMVIKPDRAVAMLTLFALLGVACSAPQWTRK